MVDRTITYTSYSEAGGVGKTTLTANLAAAHRKHGQDVIVIDLDPQVGDLTRLLDVDGDRGEEDVDNIARHLAGGGYGALRDLIRTADRGIDVLPAHNQLSQLTEGLVRQEIEADGEFNPHGQLYRVLRESEIPEDYDVVIVDPPATEGPHLYNAVYATRHLLIPVELSGKGEGSVEGLTEIVAGIEDRLGIEVGVLATVPNGVKHTTDQEAYRERIEALGYPVPVVIDDRTSLMQGCWDQHCTAFTYVEEHRSRQRDYELATLDQYETLAAFITDQFRA